MLRGACVAMVKAAYLGDGDHASRPPRLDGAWARGVVVQGAVRSRMVVVIEVARQDAPQVGLAKHDRVVHHLR